MLTHCFTAKKATFLRLKECLSYNFIHVFGNPLGNPLGNPIAFFTHFCMFQTLFKPRLNPIKNTSIEVQ